MSTPDDRPAAPVPAHLAELGRVHVVGIGGAGMSGIARVLLALGVPVSGSDAKDSRRVAAVQALGARVAIGHDAAHLDADGGVDTVVVSTAIPETNPELPRPAAVGCGCSSRPRRWPCSSSDVVPSP
jgi:UDP-N-acetylmuramate--alanine ligase